MIMEEFAVEKLIQRLDAADRDGVLFWEWLATQVSPAALVLLKQQPLVFVKQLHRVAWRAHLLPLAVEERERALYSTHFLGHMGMSKKAAMEQILHYDAEWSSRITWKASEPEVAE